MEGIQIFLNNVKTHRTQLGDIKNDASTLKESSNNGQNGDEEERTAKTKETTPKGQDTKFRNKIPRIPKKLSMYSVIVVCAYFKL